MNSLIIFIAITTLLGSALVGGVFFAFSSFVMKALAQLPAAQGIAAMQSINVVVINRSFLGTFMGTALLSLSLFVLMLFNQTHLATPYFLAGSTCYVIGTFLLTIDGNVPLNERLAAVSATDPAAVELWQHYLHRWTQWNHVRTVAALVATLIIAMGLTISGLNRVL